MKKLFAVFFILFFVFSLTLIKSENKFNEITENFKATNILLYTNANIMGVYKSSKQANHTAKESCILELNNGINNIFSINKEFLKYIFSNNISFSGIDFSFEKHTNVYKLLMILKAHIVKQEKIDNLTLIYAYSSCFSKYVIENGKKINFQICVNNGDLKLGYPLLLGSY